MRWWALLLLGAGCTGTIGIEAAPPLTVDSQAEGAKPPMDSGSAMGVVEVPPDAGPAVIGPTRYPVSATLSPFTASVVQHLKALAAILGRDDHVIMRGGDANCWIPIRAYGPISGREGFYGCLDPVTNGHKSLDLGTHTELAPTIAYFLEGRVDGGSPYVHDDVTCGEGLAVDWAIKVDYDEFKPTRLDYQLTESNPRYAMLMYGVSEQPSFPGTVGLGPQVLYVVDKLLARGVIPVMVSGPLMDPLSGPVFDVMQRGIAQARAIPFGSAYQGTLTAPGHGMGGWIHESEHPSGRCIFTPDGLQYGMNQTIFLGMSLLHRTRMALAGAAPDAEAMPAMRGAGTIAAPFEIDSVPFTHLSLLKQGVEPVASDYSACKGASADNGAGFVYHLHLAAETKLTLFGFNSLANATQGHLYHFENQLTPQQCKHALISNEIAKTALQTVTLSAGEHYFVVDAPKATDNSEFFFGISP
jgi:hypothetical protein